MNNVSGIKLSFSSFLSVNNDDKPFGKEHWIQYKVEMNCSLAIDSSYHYMLVQKKETIQIAMIVYSFHWKIISCFLETKLLWFQIEW